MYKKDQILNEKKRWHDIGFIGGVIACDFQLMREAGLDIVFDYNNALVQEYITLLKQRLETDCIDLILLVNTEIEKCIVDKSELEAYFLDEIYEHFKRYGKVYPLQAIGLHVDVITALIYLEQCKIAFEYVYKIKMVYKEILGDKSYFFARNWCHIILEVLLEFIPSVAIEEFDENIKLFSLFLKEEEILYILSINVALKRGRQEQHLKYIKEAIQYCQTWCESVPIEKRIKFQKIFWGMEGMYYRNIGEYDKAIQIYQNTIDISDDVPVKLFFLAQIGTILYVRHQWNKLKDFFNRCENCLDVLKEPNESVLDLYNLQGAYYMQIGDYLKAENQFEKAICIGISQFGEDADIVLKCKSNRAVLDYYCGRFEEARRELQKLYNIVIKDLEKYPEAFPYIFNNLSLISFEKQINTSEIKRMRALLNKKGAPYDMASNIVFKCNLYYALSASSDNHKENILDDLGKELSNYFKFYPNSEGYLEYLRGELFRWSGEKNHLMQYETLKRMENYYDTMNYTFYNREYLSYFAIKLKKLLFEKKYSSAKKYLYSLWENILFPLIRELIHQNEKNRDVFCLLMRSYISIFISAVRQYSELQIKDKELYEYLLNYKFYEELLYHDIRRLKMILENRKWISVKNINVRRNELIVECFDYWKYDLEDLKSVFANVNGTASLCQNQLCFSVGYKSDLWSKRCIELLSDLPVLEVTNKIADIFDTEDITGIEKKTWNKLREYLTKVTMIYVCSDICAIQIPLTVMRIQKEKYWGERFSIIYCNTAMNVKKDIEIQDISNSLFLGTSYFSKNMRQREGVQRLLTELPYVEFEVNKSGELTGGDIYLDENISNAVLLKAKNEIIHFATHTVESEGRKSLIIGKQKDEKAIYLESTDIVKMDWNSVKLVIFSACETGDTIRACFGQYSLNQAAKKAGAQFSISAMTEVCDGANAFFMICLYKSLVKYRKIVKSFFETQKIMRTISKQEILRDKDYIDIGMHYYLENYSNESIPFHSIDDWGVYILQMN